MIFDKYRVSSGGDENIVELDSGGYPGGSDSKESACNAEDLGSIPGSGRSTGESNGKPLQYSCLENPHGQRCLVGYSPWGSINKTALVNGENI